MHICLYVCLCPVYVHCLREPEEGMRHPPYPLHPRLPELESQMGVSRLVGAGNRTQDITHARQEHYQLSYISILVSTRVEEVCRHRLRWEDRQHLTLDKRVGELEDARDVLKLTKNIFQHTQFCTGLGRCAGCCAS